MLIWPGLEKEDMDVSSNETTEGGFGSTQMQALSHESLANMMLGVIIAVLFVTTVFVGLRIYVRARVIKKWGADDTMVTLSFATVAFHGIMLCLGEFSMLDVWTQSRRRAVQVESHHHEREVCGLMWVRGTQVPDSDSESMSG